MPLLEFIRYHQHLTGTKTGCNEGDCGACTILIGELVDEELRYRSYTSCLAALANANGKHVVTIEGLNKESKPGDTDESTLNAVQQVLYEESATQCGFCTPGFVVSLAGFCLSEKEATSKNAIAAIDGNICRCTGYKSIERAACRVAGLVEKRSMSSSIDFLTETNIIPGYFKDIKKRLMEMRPLHGNVSQASNKTWLLGGGTDLYVQKHGEIKDADVRILERNQPGQNIIIHNNQCFISPQTTVTDLLESTVMNQYFPLLQQHVKLVSSTQIRNMATIAGNFVNASPIGDFTIFFLALDAQLVLANNVSQRTIALRSFYKGYKKIDKHADEHIDNIYFELPAAGNLFSFEKVSKRAHLDIASVNSAIQLSLKNNIITSAAIAAGGVGPVPAYLEKSSEFLVGHKPGQKIIRELLIIVQSEIAPISDARGSADYKRLLLNQLLKAHFLTLFPGLALG